MLVSTPWGDRVSERGFLQLIPVFNGYFEGILTRTHTRYPDVNSHASPIYGSMAVLKWPVGINCLALFTARKTKISPLGGYSTQLNLPAYANQAVPSHYTSPRTPYRTTAERRPEPIWVKRKRLLPESSRLWVFYPQPIAGA